MNICKFEIIVEKKQNNKYLNELLQDCFSTTYSNRDDYEPKILEKYNTKGDVFKSIYQSKYLILYRRIGNIEYFIFSKDDDKLTDKITDEVVFFTDDENIGKCINQIYRDLRNKVKLQNMKVSFTDKQVFFYLNEKNDIVNQDIRIKSGFDNKSKITVGDIVRYLIFGSFSILALVLMIINWSDTSLRYSILSVMLAFFIPLLTEILIWAFSGKTVTINNFSQWFIKSEIDPHIFGSGQDYEDPQIPEGDKE